MYNIVGGHQISFIYRVWKLLDLYENHVILIHFHAFSYLEMDRRRKCFLHTQGVEPVNHLRPPIKSRPIGVKRYE